MINEKDIINTFRSLVEIDSPSKSERNVCDYIKSRFNKMNIKYNEDSTGDKIGGNCGNLYAYIDGDKNLEPILFSSHMDTVEPSKNKKAVIHSSGLITSDGNTVLGSDDFAGITAILEALEKIISNNLSHRPIEILFTVCEETLCDGVRHYDFSSLKSKDAYVFDLNGDIGTAAYCAPTIISFTSTMHGKAAHAGFEPHKGVHSIKAMSDAIMNIDCGIYDDLSVNIGTIHGGNATNIVPDLCEVKGEVRCYNHDKAIAKVDEIKKIFEKSAKKFNAKAEFVCKICVKAFNTDINESVSVRYKNTCEKLGVSAQFIKTFGGSDNNYYSNNGLNGLVVSTGMNNCHSVEEYTTKEQLINATKLAFALMTSEE